MMRHRSNSWLIEGLQPPRGGRGPSRWHWGSSSSGRLSGPLFHWSDTWQLVINTGTTIVTFLMVFLIQNAQNRDAAAIQAKLDELIRAVGHARNEFIGIEHLTENELDKIREALEQAAGDEPSRHAAIVRLIERRY